jgi:tricorn protease
MISLQLSLFVTGVLAAVQPPMYEPGLSPDGSEIAFVSGGQIWTVASSGGDARLLVADSATKSRPIYSPDGKAIAYSSTRTGNGDIYIMDLGNGASRRLTWDDAPEYLSGWSHDGKWLYFYSSSREIFTSRRYWNDIWRVAASGGTPMPVVAETYINEYHGAPSPDGKSLAFVARGLASHEWWRHGSSHIDQSQIWELELKSGKYSPLTEDVAREVWPMWSPDSKEIYFVSDKESGDNIWRAERKKKPVRISNFKNARVLWPSISSDGKTIAFEQDLGIWKFDVKKKDASHVAIRLRGSSPREAPKHKNATDFLEIALAPDGKKVAMVAQRDVPGGVTVAQGDVFIGSAQDGGETLRATTTQEESQLAWSPDSKAVAYISRRGESPHLYEWDSSTLAEQQLTFQPRAVDSSPLYSPNGMSIAFLRNGRQLMVFDRKSKRTRLVATRPIDGQPLTSGQPLAWSPDSKRIAFIGLGDDFIHNAYVVDASGGKPIQVSFLPDANQNMNSIHWAAGGHQLLFVTKQRTESGHIARVTFLEDPPKFAEDELRGLFEDKKPKARTASRPAAITLDFKNIRDRTRLSALGLDIQEVINSPDGKWLAFAAQVPANNDPGNQRVYAIAADAAFSSSPAPILLASTSGSKQFLGFSPDSKEVFFLDGTHIAAATIHPSKVRTIAATCELDVDVAKDGKTLLNDTWSILGENYYDPKMHGADWDALLKHYRGFVESARSLDETRRILNLMIGELNSSHSGVYLIPPQSTTGRIGVRFDRKAYEDHAEFKVSEVLDGSPGGIAGIRIGDVIVAVNGHPISNFEQSFENMIDKRVTVTIQGPPAHDVVVRPIGAQAEQALIYRAWRIHNRGLVDTLSKGQLGYVHLYDMMAPSLTEFFLDLDTEARKKKGVVVDLRNNNGGFVDPYAIDVLARRPYLYITPRGLSKGSERTNLGQRALERPTILIVNRHSLSDSEDFTEGYRALKLGKTVGEPTAGWIIFTSDFYLVDGTNLRVPNAKVSDLHNKDLELHPRPVDLPVPRSIGETGDSQLKAAVTELLPEVK